MSCSESKNDLSVKLSQGDITLYPSCEIACFPHITECKATEATVIPVVVI